MVIPSTMKMKMNRCGSRGSSNDNVVVILPHDIMVAILMLVPPRSLLRLKLVCKSWCALITHPDFIQKHLDHSTTNKNPLLLISGVNYAERQVLHSLNCFDYYDYNNDEHGVRLDPIPHSTTEYQSKRYWGSCNGLLCAKTHEIELAVWNPCTQEYHTVDVDDEDCTTEAFGFGYDSTTDYYKIIWIKLFYFGAARRRRLIETQVLVHTVGLTKSWEALGTVPFEVSPEHAGLFLNGGLHWIATTGCGIGMIICIDIATEEYREISKPETVSINRDDTMDEDGNVKLIALKGLLCITNYVTDEKSIEVWAMKDYFNGYDEPSSWSKLFTVKEPLMALPYPGLKYFQPISGICSKDGDEIVALVDTIRSRSLVWYNMKNEKTRTILKNYYHTGFRLLQVQTCIESLIPLHTGDYNMYTIEEMREQEKEEEIEEEERQRILRPWKKPKKNTCSCISCYNGFSYCSFH